MIKFKKNDLVWVMGQVTHAEYLDGKGCVEVGIFDPIENWHALVCTGVSRVRRRRRRRRRMMQTKKYREAGR